MFPPCHEALVNNLGGIVPPRVDVHTFLHNGIRPGAERLPNLVPAGLDLSLLLLLRLLRGSHYRAEGRGGGGRGSLRRFVDVDLWVSLFVVNRREAQGSGGGFRLGEGGVFVAAGSTDLLLNNLPRTFFLCDLFRRDRFARWDGWMKWGALLQNYCQKIIKQKNLSS